MAQLVSYNCACVNIITTFLVEANTDYEPVNAFFSVPQRYPKLYEYITIKDNPYHDGNRKFLFHVDDPYRVDVWVEISIWDDEWGMLMSHLLKFVYRNQLH